MINGVTRPYQFTNLWRSDPAKPLPEFFELRWDTPKRIGEIHLTFAGNLVFEYGLYPPLYKDPDVIKDYQISASVDGKWEVLKVVADNYQRRNIHRFDQQVLTDRIRIDIFSTNGSASAGIYEIRCYE